MTTTIHSGGRGRTRPKQDPAWAKKWRYDHHRGIRRYADAAPVRAHIQTLYQAGASYRAIAELAGVSIHVVCQVAKGQRHVRSVNATKIMALTSARIFDRGGADDFVPSIGSVRRMQALAALGHSAQTIADAMGPGATAHVVRNIRSIRSRWISRLNHDRARAAYDQLWDQPGTSHQTRAAAQRAGYAPPLAWDDDTIDDPIAQPQHQLGGDQVSPIKRVHLDDVDELAIDGLTLGQVAHRLGVSKDAVSACLRRSEHAGEAARIQRRLHYNGVGAAEIPA